MTKCLITGSAGFIYSNVVLYLQQHTDYEIVGLDKLTYAGSRLNVPESKRYKLHLGDVCDYHLVEKILEYEKPDIIIHGAAESHVDNSIANSSNFISTNVVGTHSMLEAIRKVHTPKLFINVSTDEVYGSKAKGRSMEKDPLEPRSPYSSSKASADLLGQSYFTTYGLLRAAPAY
jgi:dTDP-glucose 4,6-dehydratase